MAKTRGKAAVSTPIPSKKKNNPVLEGQQLILVKQLESLLTFFHSRSSNGGDETSSATDSMENLCISHSEIRLFVEELEKVMEGSLHRSTPSTKNHHDSRNESLQQDKSSALFSLWNSESQERIVEVLYQSISGKNTRSGSSVRMGSPSHHHSSSTKHDGKIDHGFKNDKLLLLTLFNLIDWKFQKNQNEKDEFKDSQTKFSLDSIFYSLENDIELMEGLAPILAAGTSTGIPPPTFSKKDGDEEGDGEENPDEKSGMANRGEVNQMSQEMSMQMDTNGHVILNREMSVLTELDPNQSVQSAPSGLKYLYNMIGKGLANPAQMKSIKQIVNDVIPSKSKWAKDGRQGQEKMLAQMEKVLSDLRNYTAHSFPFLKPVQKREAPNYHDIIKHPMDLSTVLKKLKAFQYFDKQDFAKDLDLIWENCLTYNTSPDSPYRVHAMKMRERCNEALKKVIEVEEDEEEQEEEDEIEEIVVKDELVSASSVALPPTIEINPSCSRGKEDDQMMDVVSEVESNAATGGGTTLGITSETADEEIVAENTIDYSLDDCFLTHQWKLATNLHRAKTLKARQELSNIPFAERPALLVKQEDLDRYVASQIRSTTRNHHNSLSASKSAEDVEDEDYKHGEDEDGEKEKKEKEMEEKVEVKSSFFLPELYPVSIPASHIPATIPAYLRDYFVYEDSPPNSIPIPPLPSLSEYPQIHPDMTSPLNYHFMNNVSEFKRLKQVYQKIAAKQSGENLSATVVRNVPSVRGGPFQRNYTMDQLPDFKVDDQTCHASLQRVVALVISHQGFDSIHQSALSTVTEIMGHILISSARLLKAFRDEIGKEHSEIELVFKVLREMGFDDADCLQMYIERDVIRHGKKLNDLRIKLESAWVNSGKMEASTRQQIDSRNQMDVDVDQHAEDIMNGTFLEDMGVDFLNVKELGLDIKIPVELWNRKNEIRANARIRTIASPSIDSSDAARASTPTFAAASPWSPIDPSSQIGLLSSLYRRLQSVPDGMIEDDQKPKSKEAKLLIKYALSGGRKIATAPKKKADGALKAPKTKKERKKKKKELATVAATAAPPLPAGVPASII